MVPTGAVVAPTDNVPPVVTPEEVKLTFKPPFKVSLLPAKELSVTDWLVVVAVVTVEPPTALMFNCVKPV